MIYESERITNICDMEEILDDAMYLGLNIKYQLPEKQKPLMEALIDKLQEAKNFEFFIERRAVHRVDDDS